MVAQENNIIKHDNIFYVRDISPLGGVETFVYELARKYKDYDIAIVCKAIAPKQYDRLIEICPVYVHNNEKINCKTIVINYDNEILDFVLNIDKVEVCETIHADYHDSSYSVYPNIDRRVKHWLGITDYSRKHFEKMFNVETELCYNPLYLEPQEKLLTLVSATRLSKIKGKERMKKLGEALDRAGVKYLWYVFTNDVKEINNPNIIFKEPDLNIRPWIANADYVVQLSDTECCSYTINEALGYNVPVIVTPLPYLKEVGYEDGKTGYTINFDCSNIDDVAKKMKTIPAFTGNIPKDGYDKYITKGKSHYQLDLQSKYVVRALPIYQENQITDKGLGRVPNRNEVWTVDKRRFDILSGKNKKGIVYVELVEIIKPEQEKKPTPKYKIISKESI